MANQHRISDEDSPSLRTHFTSSGSSFSIREMTTTRPQDVSSAHAPFPMQDTIDPAYTSNREHGISEPTWDPMLHTQNRFYSSELESLGWNLYPLQMPSAQVYQNFDYDWSHGVEANLISSDFNANNAPLYLGPEPQHLELQPYSHHGNEWPMSTPATSTIALQAADVREDPTETADSRSLTCLYGCQAKFSRPGEYRRHMKKHMRHAFQCTQAGCTMSFYRKDKLHDHLRQAHKIRL